MMGSVTCGIDEAGRGPVIGPLIVGCAVFDEGGVEELRKLNVRDSKRVSPSRRSVLEPQIKEIALEWRLIELSPGEIDRLRKRHSLNAIEAMKVAELILSLENTPDTVLVDAVDSVSERYTMRIIDCLQSMHSEFIIPELISEHKADDTYIEVSAASILAKVERDRIIEGLCAEHGDFGSGYPSDERTQRFVKMLLRQGPLPEFVRRSWNTIDKSKQMSLGEF